MKIAIIGGSSFIGKIFLNYFQELKKNTRKEFNFIVFSSSKSSTNNITIPYHFPNQKLNYDILLECDVIINFTAKGLNGVNNEVREILYEINLFEPIRLAHNLDSNEFKGKLITFGSSHEIGKTDSDKSLNEEQLLNLSNPCFNDYGLSKRLLSRFIHDSGIGIKWIHLILPNVYGTKHEPSHRIIPYLLNSMIQKKNLNLNNIDNSRQFLHVLDLCELIGIIIEATNTLKGVYNVAPTEQFTIRELVLFIEEVFSCHYSEREKVLEKVNVGNYLLLNGKKLEDALMWKPKRIIKKEIQMFKELTIC